MNILLIEDEPFAAKSLQIALQKLEPAAQIEGPVSSVEEARKRLSGTHLPDLILCDIQLADGIAFDIFKEDIPAIPVIFTTAFNEFALRAFKLNSIDYLLKPINAQELADALTKFKKIHAKFDNPEFMARFRSFFGKYPDIEKYKERLPVHEGKAVVLVNTDDILYFQKTGELISLVSTKHNEYLTDYRSLEEVSELLDPAIFYRANRQFLIHTRHLERYQSDAQGRILLYFAQPGQPEIAVSKDRAADFKKHIL